MAELLVKEKVAACVSISPHVVSVYQWKGKLETEEEVMLFIKTTRANYPNVEKVIKNNHSYDVPEIIVLPVLEAEEKYGLWVKESVIDIKEIS